MEVGNGHAEEVDNIAIQCTRCAVELSESVGGVRHPRLPVAVCVLCADAVDEEEEDACAWCGEGGTLLCCDDCDRAFCAGCLTSNVDAEYVASVESADSWRCVACDPTPLASRTAQLEVVLQWDAGNTSDDDDDASKDGDDEDEEVRTRLAERLMKIESEIAESQEALEFESIDRHRSQIALELSEEAAVEKEIAIFSALHTRKLELLSLSQSRAQERLDTSKRKGIFQLEEIYMAMAAADAAGTAEAETAAWREAPGLASRKRGRVSRLAKKSKEDASSSSEASESEMPEYAAEASTVLAAQKHLKEVRPVKRKRGTDGREVIEGDTIGATGFNTKRREELGEAVYEAIYKSENPVAARAMMKSIRAQEEESDESDYSDGAVEEIDPGWRERLDDDDVFGRSHREEIERNEGRWESVRVETIDALTDEKAERLASRKAYRSRDGYGSPGKRQPRKKEARRTKQQRQPNGLTTKRRVAPSMSSLSQPDFDDEERISTQATTNSSVRPTTQRSIGEGYSCTAPSQPQDGFEVETLVPNSVGALAMLYVPGGGQSGRDDPERHYVMPPGLTPSGEPIVVGRATPDRLTTDASFIALFKGHEQAMPREIATIRLDPSDGYFKIQKLTPKVNKTIFVEGAERQTGDDADLLRNGSLEFKSGKIALQCYWLLPRNDVFELPAYSARHFDPRPAVIRKEERALRPHNKSESGQQDDPIVLEEEDIHMLEASTKKKRRELKSVLEDNFLSSETLLAKKREQEKRERLALRRRSDVNGGDSQSQSQSGLECVGTHTRTDTGFFFEEEDDDDDDETLLTLNAAGDESRVVIPRSIGVKMKPHQVEGARFLFDQSVESLEVLNREDDAYPLGCVLAHSMGLGKSLTTIALISGLLSHPVASAKLRTVLVVAPTNVVRNWENEFKKWTSEVAALKGRVFVVDTAINTRASRVHALEEWRRKGGVAIIGYDLYQNCVKATTTAVDNEQSTRERITRESLEDLVNTRVLLPAEGSITYEAACGDLTAQGTIMYNNVHYSTPTAFTTAIRGPAAGKINGWDKVNYNGKRLDSYRAALPSKKKQPVAPVSALVADEYALRARACLQDPGPDLLILDEAHLIKNPQSQRFLALNAVKTKRRIALTGTPLQNNLLEYHTMITFVRGLVLGTKKEFKNRFSDPIENGMCTDSSKNDVDKMKRRSHVLLTQISDFVQRKDEALLAREVGKTEYLVECCFSEVQRKLYKEFRDSLGTKNFSSVTTHQPILKLGNHPQTHLMRKIAASTSLPSGIFNKEQDITPLPSGLYDKEQELSSSTLPLPSGLYDKVQDPSSSSSMMPLPLPSGHYKVEEQDPLLSSSNMPLPSYTKEEDPPLSSTTLTVATTTPASLDQPPSPSSPSSTIVSPLSGEAVPASDEDPEDLVCSAIVVRKQSDEEDDDDDDEDEEEEDEVVVIEQAAVVSTSSGEVPASEPSKWNWPERVAAELSNLANPFSVELSGKTLILFDLLAHCIARGDKVVVFSQSIPTLDLIESILQHETWHGAPTPESLEGEKGGGGGWRPNRDYYRIDGKVAGTERQKYISAFEDPMSKSKVFLLSTKAGNMGINLVSASRVILFDTSWNPAHDRQALFRCFRYGQSKHVFIYRLVAPGLEASIHRRAQQKELLSHRVVDEKAYDRIYEEEDLNGGQCAIGDPLNMSADKFSAELLASDDVLRKVLARKGARHVSSAIVTDTLLRENSDEILDEEDRAAAMDEFIRERDGRPTREQEEAQKQRRLEEAQNRDRLATMIAEQNARQVAPLPDGWHAYHDKQQRPYYHNPLMNLTTWQRPEPMEEAQMASL